MCKIRFEFRFKTQVLTLFRLLVPVIMMFTLVESTVYINSDNMSPTLQKGNIYRGVKPSYISDLEKGDIVCIQLDGQVYINRVVGLPNDKVEFIDIGERTKLKINDLILKENKLWDLNVDNKYNHPNFPLTVKEGCVYVLGDNRVESVDSRSLGVIPIDNIKLKLVSKPISVFDYFALIICLFILFGLESMGTDWEVMYRV